MKAMHRRLDALEGRGLYWSIGDLLDHLDGVPLPKGRSMSPEMEAQFAAMKVPHE